jgi:dipeptidyl aminopeptidase/acylaminoacyl peptidase
MSETDAERLEALPELKQATVGPDSERVAFYYSATGRNELHVLDLESGECDQRSDGQMPESNRWPLAWTPDDRVLYHHDESEGSERRDVYAIDAAGETEPVVETDGTTTVRGVSDDGGTLLVRSNHAGGMDAHCYDLATGEGAQLTDADHPVWRPVLSPDGDRVAYAASGAREGVEADPNNRDVVVADASGAVERTIDLGEHRSSSAPAACGPDGDTLLVSDNATDVTRAGRYDLDTGELRWLGNAEYVESPECFMPGGDRVVVSRKRDAVTVPVVYDVETGQGRELHLPPGVAHFGRRSTRVVDHDRILLLYTTPTRRPELLVYDLTSEEYEVVFEREYGPFSPDDFAEPDHARVPSDGVPETPAAAIDHDPGEPFDVDTLFYDGGERPSPLVVFPHGGPHLSDRLAFNARVQFLCQRGYSVLQVNYRGSSGRGRSFSRALHGDWGGAEQGDVATSVEHVLDEYDWLDEDRVAVYGGSFGGFSAVWQLVQYPNLYSTGVAIVPMTDLRDMYENTVEQFRSGFLQTHLGTPEESPDLYRERSPVTHAENLDAPLLLVHGENDPRVPVSQSRRFCDALRDCGVDVGVGEEAGERAVDGRDATNADCDVEYHELDGSGHFGNSEEGVPRPLALLDDFLDRRL